MSLYVVEQWNGEDWKPLGITRATEVFVSHALAVRSIQRDKELGFNSKVRIVEYTANKILPSGDSNG